MVIDVFIPNVLCNKRICNQVPYVVVVNLDDLVAPTPNKV